MYNCNVKSMGNGVNKTNVDTKENDTAILTNDKAIMVESFRRYKDIWLPLVAAVNPSATNSPIELYPPPDIAWLWHCHRLAPKQYYDYCHETFGRTIEAYPPFTLFVQGEGTSRTMSEWTKLFPQESFFLQVNHITAGLNMKEYMSTIMCGFDLLESTQRQENFLWQVSGERFEDNDFLAEGVENYYRFLKLKSSASTQGIILVPTYQIDLMWHTHILSSIDNYNADCIHIVNSTLHHDDSLTDRSDGGVLDISFAETTSLWMKEYGTDYIVTGGMYRGEPPSEYYTTKWRSYDDCLPSITMNVALIGKVGASSTGIAGPTQWAKLNGCASDGKPSFVITPDQQMRFQIRPLPRKLFYVLGRPDKKDTGYYHIETREANQILLKRVNHRLSEVEYSLAHQASCCGPIVSMSEYEQKRRELVECRELLLDRCTAATPTGATKRTKIRDIPVFDSSGHWSYPMALYDGAGGACGGVVGATVVAGESLLVNR